MLKGLVMALAVCVLMANGIQDSRAASAGGGAAGVPPPAGGTPATPWILMACPALIVIAAFVNHHRELTAQEAWSCGLLALFPWQAPVDPPLRVKG
jgi:hypothetical protein